MATSPVFIVGPPRSGTTFVVNALVVNQPAVSGSTAESMLYAWKDRRPYSAGALLESSYFNSLLDKALLLEAINRNNSHLSLFKDVIEVAVHRDSASIFVEKSPVHIFYWKQIAADFPGARFIVLHRNAAAVIHSMVRTPWIELQSDKLGPLKHSKTLRYFSATMAFARYQKRLKSLKCLGSKEQILQLSFEKIMSGQTDLRVELSDFLHISLDPLYQVRSFSEKSMGKYSKDRSRIDSYREAMPEFWQSVGGEFSNPGKQNAFSARLFKKWVIDPLTRLLA